MKDIWIAGISTGHNASTCLLKNGELIFYIEEERLSRKKYDENPFLSIDEIFKYTDKLDYLVVADNTDYPFNSNPFIIYCFKTKLIESDKQVYFQPDEHHLYHAANAFYASGFKEAVCIVVDAQGSFKTYGNTEGWEVESVYKAKYPDLFGPRLKRLYNPFNQPSICENFYQQNQFGTLSIGKIEVTNKQNIGALYSGVSVGLGFGNLDCGKVMGLSSYSHNYVDIVSLAESCDKHYISKIKDINLYKREDISYSVQKHTQEKMLSLIEYAINNSGCSNVVISGGYGLNCVANYFYKKSLPHINFYVDPISHDGGLSIGASKLFYHRLTKDTTIKPQDTLYTGTYIPEHVDGHHVSYKDIVSLLTSGNIVAMFQGRSEAGPRALGNRSILFDPRIINGKDIVNTIKNREYFRPFAGSVLHEYCHEWFDMAGLEESPFMMYAVDVKEDKKSIIPSVVHVDGTCRVQTLKEHQNYHFYNLVKQFFNETGVPVLFNTSFNLAGDPLVETIEDAISTLNNSDIDYLYLPEYQKLITIKGQKSYAN